MNIVYRTLDTIKGNWYKGPQGPGGTKCVMAHLIDNSDYELKDYAKARDILNDVVIEQFPDRTYDLGIRSYHSVVKFNDHPDTTEDDVVAVLEKAAVKYDELYGEA